MDKNELIKKDLLYNWHPYTQMKDCEADPPILIRNAKGSKLFDQDGKFYFDVISSWWCNVHGHSHEKIINAVNRQINKLDHTLFAGFTHEPAVELAEKLIDISPDNLKRVYYSDNGSTSVEVAMKMSFQYWKNRGELRKEKFLSLDKGYHGDTIGAMSVGGVDKYNAVFKPLFFDTYKTLAPYCYRCTSVKKDHACEFQCLANAEKILVEKNNEIAAIIIEPMVLGAGGMIIYPKEYLTGIGLLAKKYNVHLIVDEVATGFGRTGKMFASEHADILPDFMCVSKGITSGYLPLAATLTTQQIYDSFYADFKENKTFYHGHTYTANPIACAAANASIDLFHEEGTLNNATKINAHMVKFLNELKDLDHVGDVRSIGAIGAIELVENKKSKAMFPPEDRLGLKIYREGLKHNLILRPLGDIIYFFLPLSLKQDELEDIFMRSKKVLNSVLDL